MNPQHFPSNLIVMKHFPCSSEHTSNCIQPRHLLQHHFLGLPATLSRALSRDTITLRLGLLGGCRQGPPASMRTVFAAARFTVSPWWFSDSHSIRMPRVGPRCKRPSRLIASRPRASASRMNLASEESLGLHASLADRASLTGQDRSTAAGRRARAIRDAFSRVKAPAGCG